MRAPQAVLVAAGRRREAVSDGVEEGPTDFVRLGALFTSLTELTVTSDAITFEF